MTKTKPLKPVPADFAEKAATMCAMKLADHYRCGRLTMNRWIAETGIQPAAPVRFRPVPADFATLAPNMTKVDLARHYGCARETVRRWLKESGVQSLVFDRVPPPVNPPRRLGNVVPTRGKSGLFHGVKVSSIYDEAAATLQRERWVVYRSDEDGKANGSGRFWRMGNLVVTPDELLRRAARYERRAA